MEREDGTLLRAKATPNGILGYLTGKVVSQAGMTVAIALIVLIPAGFLFDGLELGSVSSWLTLAGMLVLGLIATLPIGALIGSLFNSAQSLGFVTLLIMGLVVISGVFYPITALPEWLQWIGQIFPIYWLGLGMRSALSVENRRIPWSPAVRQAVLPTMTTSADRITPPRTATTSSKSVAPGRTT